MNGPQRVNATGRTQEAAETADASEHLRLWYDEPATAGFDEIFSSKFAFRTSEADGWLEFGRGDSQNYTDGKNHSSSKTAPDGTWDVTDAVKQGVAWAKHALPVGNGHMGAMTFGYTDTEVIQMNENTLWTGGAGCEDNMSDSNDADVYGNKNVKNPFDTMSNLIDSAFAEFYSSMESGKSPNNAKATPVNDYIPNNREQEGAYQSFCEMKIDYNQDFDKTSDYVRELDLNDAISSVSYEYEGTTYVRELFASCPDDVMVYKISASEKGNVNFTLHPEIPHMGIYEGRYNSTTGSGATNYGKSGNVVAEGDTITLSGTLKHNGMKFAGTFKVITNGGTMQADNETVTLAADNSQNRPVAETTTKGRITVSGADEAYVIVSLTTDYVNDFDKNYTTGETLEQLTAAVKAKTDAAAEMGYSTLLANHEQDYKELFDRVKLDIGASVPEGKTTDVLIDEYQANYKGSRSDSGYNKYLETLYYQYGRYLLIASSREGNLPANLQGLWNDTDRPAWNSDYHTNINVQMNYWLAESTNLAELATPLVDYANSLRKPGRLTLAKTYGLGYNSDESLIDLDTEDGFIFFCSTAPRGFTGNIDSNASFTQTATAFLAQNLYDYYAYTKDMEYLKSDVYPFLRESCVTFLQTLEPGRTEEDKDKLYVAPSWSSEQGPWTVGTYFDQQLVWQLFHDTIQAMEDMGIQTGELTEGTGYLTDDTQLLARLKDAIDRLDPVELGEDGQIKEWQQETTYNKTASGNTLGDSNGAHRHISQLIALYPGNYITKNDKELMDGAEYVLEQRTDTSTGWGLAFRLNLWARTGDGNHAYDIVNALLATNTYDNLFDTHAPFQIDGNFGATAGMTEMLLQSQNDTVELLPALPDAWADGSYEGLVARGNYEIDLKWADGKAYEAQITSNNGGELVLTGMDVRKVTDASGNAVEFYKTTDDEIVIETKLGMTYDLSTDGPQVQPTTRPVKSEEPQQSAEPVGSGEPVRSAEPVESGAPQTTGVAVSETPSSEDPEEVMPGDVDDDGDIKLTDAQLVLKAALKLTQLDEKHRMAADVNKDDVVNLLDAQLILKRALLLIKHF